jgi:hypothetical protein
VEKILTEKSAVNKWIIVAVFYQPVKLENYKTFIKIMDNNDKFSGSDPHYLD